MAGLNPLYPAPDKWRPGDNLLDNWYFVGGGSQLGWGTFPVNQLGQVEYAANGGYAFDRWKLGYTVSAGKVMITPEGVKLIRNTLDSGVSEISQVLRFAPKDMVTLSILSADNELTTATGKLGVLAGGNSKNGLRFATTTDIVRIRSVGVQELTLVAAKLEEGPVQTLAHKEGGKWVVNRVPDFREELAKCQAYQLKTPNGGSLFASVGIGTVISETTAQILIPTPVSMRTLPFATITGKWFLRGGGKIVTFNAGEAGVRVTATQYSENAITLEITGLTGLPVNYAMELMRDNDATAQILIDDNL